MRYKKLTEKQIIISLDRLTRFKPVREKYYRVFSEIIFSNLLEPKLKKSDIEKLSPKELAEIVSEIFNNSLPQSDNNLLINKKIKEYEESISYLTDTERILLDNTINFSGAIDYIKEDSPQNLLWLKELGTDKNIKTLREKKGLKFPIEKVIIAEGITEEILIPAFSKFCGYDFDKKGVHIIAAGGKNQVVKLYYELSQSLKLPIFIILDKDAEQNINQIKPRLRKCDFIHLVSCGEFEDLLSKKLIIKTINSHFENFLELTVDEIDDSVSRVCYLEEVFKTRGLHEFKKAEFAKLVKENIQNEEDLTPEIINIINEISKK